MWKKLLDTKNIKKIIKRGFSALKRFAWQARRLITARNKKGQMISLLIGKYLLFLFLALCIFTVCLFFYYTYDLPRPENFTETPFIQSTKIYDRTGKVLLYDIYGEEKREIVAFDKISDNLK